MGSSSACSPKEAASTTSRTFIACMGIPKLVALDGEVLEGAFPSKQMKLLLAWMAIHEDELLANWNLLSEGEGYFKIDPLR